jgi:Flp pilus assembly protein TadG
MLFLRHQLPFSVASSRGGFAAMYTVIILIALCGFVSLAVDFGRVQLAKSELQTAADAAVRAAATGLATSVSQSRADAAAIALANLCDGVPVTLDTSADVEFGTWNTQTKTFTALGGAAQDNATAVRITANRLAARNTAIPLTFARVVGRNTCDVRASAIATMTKGSIGGFVGLNGVSITKSALFASYHTAYTKHPDQGWPWAHGSLASNGAIKANATLVLGDVHLGPSGSVSGCLVTGDVDRMSSPILAPTSPAWNPVANPGGIPQNYTVNSSVTLSGGTYYFTSLTIKGILSFSSPATIYVNGNITLDGALIASDWVPSNLKIYQIGTSRTFCDANSTDMLLVADVESPGSDFTANDSVLYLGSGTFNTMTLKNGAAMFNDEAAGPVTGKAVIAVVH